MYKSQEMPNLRRFLALVFGRDNHMTIIFEIVLCINLKMKNLLWHKKVLFVLCHI